MLEGPAYPLAKRAEDSRVCHSLVPGTLKSHNPWSRVCWLCCCLCSPWFVCAMQHIRETAQAVFRAAVESLDPRAMIGAVLQV